MKKPILGILYPSIKPPCTPAILSSVNDINTTGVFQNDYLLWRDELGNDQASFSIHINGINYRPILQDMFNFTSVTSLDDVAQVIQDTINTQGNLVTVIYDSEIPGLVITTVSNDENSMIYVDDQDVQNDISLISGMLGLEARGSCNVPI